MYYFIHKSQFPILGIGRGFLFSSQYQTSSLVIVTESWICLFVCLVLFVLRQCLDMHVAQADLNFAM